MVFSALEHCFKWELPGESMKVLCSGEIITPTYPSTPSRGGYSTEGAEEEQHAQDMWLE